VKEANSMDFFEGIGHGGWERRNNLKRQNERLSKHECCGAYAREEKNWALIYDKLTVSE